MPGNNRVTIVGAGLAGSLVAILLRIRGFDVEIFERREDSRITGFYGGRSINLALSHRGLRALARANLDSRALELSIPMRGRQIHNREGKTSFQAYSPHPNEYINSISRAGLNELLLDRAERIGVNLRFGYTCRDFDFERGVVSFTREDGTSLAHPASVVIGADGAGSGVRTAMENRGFTTSVIDQLAHGYKELTIAPGHGGKHRLETEALHIWPRRAFMLIALPNQDGSFTCTLFLSIEGTPGFSALDSRRTVSQFFESEFPDAAPLIEGLDSEFENNPSSFLQTVRCQKWNVGGRALLLGDAAHAIVPFYGQGMNCALEDCAILDDLIADSLRDGGPEWASVFERFNESRMPDANAIAELALGNFAEMRDKVADPSFLLQKQLESVLANRFPGRYTPIYSHVTFSDIPYAEALRLSRVQQDLLGRILDARKNLNDIDWAAVEDLL